MSTLELFWHYREGLLSGLGVTLRLSATVWFFGLSFGGLLGLAGATDRVVGRASGALAFFLAGTPLLVLLFWLHYPAQSLAGVVVDPFYTAALTLSVLNVLAVSETVRHAALELPAELATAGRVCGLSARDIARHIQLPLVLRRTAPTLLMIQVNMLQATLFASLISVDELFRVVQRINATEYRPIELYSVLAVFYLAICLPLNGIALLLRRRFGRDLSER